MQADKKLGDRIGRVRIGRNGSVEDEQRLNQSGERGRDWSHVIVELADRIADNQQ